MKIERLTSRPDGTVAALMLVAGDEVEVIFSTSHARGISVASPDQDIFAREAIDAAGVRAIIRAVIAFESVAAYSSERRA